MYKINKITRENQETGVSMELIPENLFSKREFANAGLESVYDLEL
jgi:hypothetical protein